MKKTCFNIAVLFLLLLTGCSEDVNTNDLVPSYSLTTMAPHSYAEINGTYRESLISEQYSIYDSLYESMYPENTKKRIHNLQAVTGVTGIKSSIITTVSIQKNDAFMNNETSVCVINLSEEEFESLVFESEINSELSEAFPTNTSELGLNENETSVTAIPAMDDEMQDLW